MYRINRDNCKLHVIVLVETIFDKFVVVELAAETVELVATAVDFVVAE